MKILGLDIETAPNTAFVWGMFKENVPLDRLIETGRVMCFSAKWVGRGKEPLFFSEFHDGHKTTIEAAHKLLDEADAVLTYNGERFDIPTLNKEFIKYGMGPPAPYHSIDLIRTVRSRFRFTSNKLAHIVKELDVSRKVENRGFDLWIDCMNGDKKAWREMRTYNKGDVTSLEEAYIKLRPWIDTHPNSALFMGEDEDPKCPHCGSKHLQARGYQRTRAQTYPRFQCQGCGAWLRGRYTVAKGRKDVLATIGGT